MIKLFCISTLIILILPIASAEIICSDGSEVDWKLKELDIGSSKSINGLTLGASKTKEFNVVKKEEFSVVTRIEVGLIIDGIALTLTNSSEENIEISDKKYTVKLTNFTSTDATIDIDGSVKKITEDEVEIIKQLEVGLVDINANIVKIVVGTKEFTLTSDEKPTELVALENITYIVELVSGSADNALIKVNKCNTGDIKEISGTVSNNSVINETTVDNTPNTTVENQEPNTTGNNTVGQENTEEEKKGIFRRFFAWLKKILRLP